MKFKKLSHKYLILSLLISIQLSMFVFSSTNFNDTGIGMIKSADTEPNDDANHANLLQEGMTYGNVSSSDEWDWYAIYCLKDDNLVIDYSVIHDIPYALYPAFICFFNFLSFN